jgi:molybdopterin molybdotransferase
MADLVSVETARAAVLGAVPAPSRVEHAALLEALGCAVAFDVVSATTLPPWDNSAMDGYALQAGDIAAAAELRPVRLPVVGDVAAGVAPARQVDPGSAVRVATGAPLPEGADAVIPVEETTPIDAAGTPGTRGRDATGPAPVAIDAHRSLPVGANIRRAGSDLRAGDVILPAGMGVTPAAIALAAGAGHATLPVRPRPLVAVLATGDEVRAPGEALGPAGIPDANGPGLRALATAAGAVVLDLGIAADRLDDVLDRLRRALEAGADAIIVSGGVSVGPYDVVKLAFEAIGRIDLWRVAVQPGKPFAFGVAARSGEPGRADGPRTLLFGLPGNPVSGFVTFELFVRPALRRIAGHAEVLRPVDRGVLLDEATKSPTRRAFLRVTAERDAAGMPVRDGQCRARVRLARGPGGQGSHVLSALAAADALAVVPEDVEVHRAGDPVELWWLDRA